MKTLEQKLETVIPSLMDPAQHDMYSETSRVLRILCRKSMRGGKMLLHKFRLKQAIAKRILMQCIRQLGHFSSALLAY